MRTELAGLNLGLRALIAQQIGVDTTSHNIANVNTEGYSRQNAFLQATRPIDEPRGMGQLGTGVDVDIIQRMRSSFVDRQMRSEQGSFGYWQQTDTGLRQVEAIFIEISESAIGGALGRFWNAWREVADQPNSLAARNTLVARAVDLTSIINQTDTRLKNLQDELDRQVVAKVSEINSLTADVAKLNQQIRNVVASGQQPNDLRDRRDLVLEKLAKLIKITYRDMDDGTVAVTAYGNPLVTGEFSYAIQTPEALRDERPMHNLTWADGTAVVFDALTDGGELKALVDLRDQGVQQRIDEVNKLALALIRNLNQKHRGEDLPPEAGTFSLDPDQDGPSNEKFFEGIDQDDTDPDRPWNRAARSIALNLTLLTNSRLIRAGLADRLSDVVTVGPDGLPQVSPQPHNNRNALRIADMQNQNVMASGLTTIDGFYNQIIVDLGVDAQAAKRALKTEETVTNHLKNRQQEIAGVSMDEEALKLVAYQRAYQGAARLINIVDTLLNLIVNGLGVSGR